MNKIISTIATWISTTVITPLITMSVTNNAKQPVFHLTMCSQDHKNIQLNSFFNCNEILKISNDSEGILALDVAAIFEVEANGHRWIISKILADKIDNNHPIYIQLLEDLPTKRNYRTISYKLRKAWLFYTKCTGQKRYVTFKLDSKMIIQTGRAHVSHYSITDENFHKGPYKIMK